MRFQAPSSCVNDLLLQDTANLQIDNTASVNVRGSFNWTGTTNSQISSGTTIGMSGSLIHLHLVVGGTLNLRENCTSKITTTGATVALTYARVVNWGNLDYTSSSGIRLTNGGSWVNQVGGTMTAFASLNDVRLIAATAPSYFDNYGTVNLVFVSPFAFR